MPLNANVMSQPKATLKNIKLRRCKMEEPQSAGFLNIILLLVMSIPLAVTAFLLARQKGRNAVLWTIIALIPMVNFFSMWYFVGASNLNLEKKIDELLSK